LTACRLRIASKLAKGQQVYWGYKDVGGFLYPPESYMDKIQAIAKKSVVKIHFSTD